MATKRAIRQRRTGQAHGAAYYALRMVLIHFLRPEAPQGGLRAVFAEIVDSGAHNWPQASCVRFCGLSGAKEAADRDGMGPVSISECGMANRTRIDMC